jgi:hypothetical protein
MNAYRLFQVLAVVSAIGGAVWVSLGLARIVGGHPNEGLYAIAVGGINFAFSLVFGKICRRLR